MKSKLIPLKVGDRVRHYYTRSTGRVTNIVPLAVDWSDDNGIMTGYTRAELRKLPAMRCHCPDCDRSRGRKPCPLQDRVADSICGALDAAGAARASHLVMGADAAIAVVAHIVRNFRATEAHVPRSLVLTVDYQKPANHHVQGAFKIGVDASHAYLLPIQSAPRRPSCVTKALQK